MNAPLPYRFDDPARAIAITQADLPAPWINYLSNGNLHAFVSQTGAGCLWWKSPINFRLTRYRGWTSPVDGPGFTLYIREPDGSAWCPTVHPTRLPLDSWEARHAPGRTTFTARRGDLSVELTLFIAPDTDTMVWDVALTNHGKTTRTVDLFGYVELVLLEWPHEPQWGYYTRNMFHTWYAPEAAAQLYLWHHQGHPRLADIPLVYFASTEEPASWSGDRQSFLGYNRGEDRPQALERNRCGNGSLWCGDPCAALQIQPTLAPDETKSLAFFLGCQPRAMGDFTAAKAALPGALDALRQPGWVAAQRAKLDAWWSEHFAAADFCLPDADLQRQISTWSPVNSVHAGRYSRSFSQFASGIRGFGYRDTAQDMLAQAARRPEWARAEFKRLLAHQFEDGHAVHTYFPEDKQAPWRTIHSDDHLWLPLLAHQLAAETGDRALFSENVPYLAADGMSAGPEATVWEHLIAATEFTESKLGAHGIPLTLHSDWNDCIGRFARKGKGQSVFAAQQYVLCLRLLIELATWLGDTAAAAKLQTRLTAQETALNTRCWDGEWWVRGFDDEGLPMGSKHRKHGQIWLNSQSWSVLSVVGSRQQHLSAMDAVHRILNTERGIKKIHPSFPTYPDDMDAFVGYSLGCAENGAIFCHANTWAVIAEALLGRADRAWQYFRQLVPHLALQRAGLDRYQGEPYAWASLVTGPENPRFGWANVTHVTGTAAWMDLAATQYLLGIRPELECLRIAPVLPADWPGFTATRRFRGCQLEIDVRRSHPGERPGLSLDGQPLHGDRVPATALDGKPAATVQLILPA
jgi:cellobiose phosphorylase